MTSKFQGKHPAALAVLAATALLWGCDQNSGERTVGEKVDQTLAKMERKGDEMKAGAQEAMDSAKQAATTSAEAVGNKTKDALITTGVKSRLVAEPTLKSLSINVDTQDGRVVLQGAVPDANSRDRAATLAGQVDGVATVQNELVVDAKR